MSQFSDPPSPYVSVVRQNTATFRMDASVGHLCRDFPGKDTDICVVGVQHFRVRFRPKTQLICVTWVPYACMTRARSN